MGKKRCRCACPTGKEQPRSPTKRWNPEFSKHRNVRALKDPLFIEVLEQSDNQRDFQDAFVSESEICGSSWEGEQVRNFLREAGTIPESEVWVDCRAKKVRSDSTRPTWLSSDQLIQAMRLRYSEQQSPSLPRRCLSFVPYVTPRMLEGLIKCATDKEIKILRHAVCKYFGEETLIRVHTSVEGFPVFRLVLNLPRLSLEEVVDVTSEVLPLVDNHNKKEWALLPLKNSIDQKSQQLAIYETKSTVVLSGCCNSHWFGYALGNIGPVDTTRSDDDDDSNDSEAEPEEDFFATGGCAHVLNPENPSWDPRIYFLRAAEIRLTAAAQASEYLVRKIDAECRDWVPQLPDRDSDQRALEKIAWMTKVLRRLRNHFAQSLRAWDRFSGTGDIMYFADLRTHPTAREALSHIEKSFEKISDLEYRVGLQESDCAADAKILKMRMTQEGNSTMKKSNQLHLKSVEMTMRGLEVTQRAGQHSEKAAASALMSLITARDMGRSTRVNVQLFSMTTAVVLALQYFCSDRALFAFERNTQAFWISIVVLVLSFLALSNILHALDQLKDVVAGRMFGTPKIIAASSEIPPVEYLSFVTRDSH